MKISVDLDLCELHGQCVFAAPEVFDITDADDLIFPPEVGQDQAPVTRAAAVSCPVQAIMVED